MAIRLHRAAVRRTGLRCVTATLLAAAARAQGLEPGDLVVADRGGLEPARLVQIERATGVVRTLYTAYDGVLVAPRDVEADAAGALFASQSAIPNRLAPERIVRVDAATGAATVVTEGGLLGDVDGIAIAADGALLAVDHGSVYGVAPALVRVDVASGAQSVIASGGSLVRPVDVVAESATHAVVLDAGTGAGARLVRVELATGAQTVFAAGGALGTAAGGVARDPDGSFVVASAFGALARVAPGGVVTPIAGGPGVATVDVALEPDGDALVLVGGAADRIDRVAGGVATTLAGGFTSPQGVAVVPSAGPFCDVEVGRPSYANGDKVRTTTLRFANPSAAVFSTRLRLRLAIAGLPAPVDLVNAAVTLPARFDAELAPFDMLQVQAWLPRGSWELRCALEDPATSAAQYQDAAPFGVH